MAKEPKDKVELFDLGSLDLTAAADAGAVMPVYHPVKATKTGATITVLGADSMAYRRNLRRMRDEVAKSPEREPTDPDDAAILNAARVSAAAITGWSNLSMDGATPLTFSPAAAVDLLVKRTWLITQVESYRAERSNFFRD